MPRFPHASRHPVAALMWVIQFLFGILSVLVMLAVSATIPVLNLISLGYLLEAQGRIARSGKWWYAMPQLPAAARLGTVLASFAVAMLAIWYLADVAHDAALIAPQSHAARSKQLYLAVAAIATAIHLVLAVARGGSLSCFLRPIKNIRWLLAEIRGGDFSSHIHTALISFLAALRLPQRLWFGLCAFLGTLLWLIGPSILFASIRDPAKTWQRLAVLIGGICLIPVLAWLPFLQVHSSAENRSKAIFELRHVRELFAHAPLAWFIATVVFYAASVPLFLWSAWYKMQIEPHHAILDLTVISVVTMYPARVLVAWAYYRATQQPRRWGGWRWILTPILGLLLAAYVYLLFLSSVTAEFGRHWLNQYHALLLPVPW